MIAHVADWVVTGAGSSSASVSGTTTPSNALIVVCLQTGGPASSVSLSDGGSNSYAFIGSAAGGSNDSTVYMYYAKNANPTSYINASTPGGGAVFMSASVFTGADQTAPLVSYNSQSNPSVSDPAPCTVSGVSGGCAVGVIGVGVSSRTLTLQNSYTQFIDIKGSSRNMLAARTLTTTNASTAPDWIISSGSATSTFEVTAAFKPASSTPTYTYRWYNGTTEVPVTVQGVWNGSTVVPVTLAIA